MLYFYIIIYIIRSSIMSDVYSVMGDVYSGLSKAAEDCGFKPVIPSGTEKGELPVITDNGRVYIDFTGENKAFRIEHFNNKIALYGASKEGAILDTDFSRLTLSLLEPEEATEKDIRFVVNDFSDTLIETFGTINSKPTKVKLPPPVSKAAAKSGAVSYDPNTLANRFTTIFPELRDEYKANCEKYGQFLPEDFFVNFGTPRVLEAVRKNDPAEMKRLFKLLNEIYDDGTNATQSLICVTILGVLENEDQLASCIDYMSDELTAPVIQINKFLWSKDGKGAKIKLENPPKYKPKRKSKSPLSKIGM